MVTRGYFSVPINSTLRVNLIPLGCPVYVELIAKSCVWFAAFLLPPVRVVRRVFAVESDKRVLYAIYVHKH